MTLEGEHGAAVFAEVVDPLEFFFFDELEVESDGLAVLDEALGEDPVFLHQIVYFFVFSFFIFLKCLYAGVWGLGFGV